MPKRQTKFEFSKPTFGPNTSESRMLSVPHDYYQRSQKLAEKKKKQMHMQMLHKPIECISQQEKLQIIKEDSFPIA